MGSEGIGLKEWLSFLWVVLIPTLWWFWNRLQGAHNHAERVRSDAQGKIAVLDKNIELMREQTLRQLAEHRAHVAENHFNKEEVREIVAGNLKPIQKSLESIEKNVNMLIDREMNRGSER